MRVRSCLVLIGLIVLVGCEDDSSRSARPAERPDAIPAARTFRAPAPPGSPVELRHKYPFENRHRRVVSTLTVGSASGKVRDPSQVIPTGRRPVRVSVRIDDRGPDTFPFEWARFTLVDRKGAAVEGYLRTALRRLLPSRRRSPRQTFLTFLVPAGFSPAEVRLSSIVRLWPFKARWRFAR